MNELTAQDQIIQIKQDQIIQIKMVNGDEVICKLHAQGPDDGPTLVISEALQIMMIEDEQGSFWVMKSWMARQLEQEGLYQLINPSQIMCQCLPETHMLEQYHKTLEYVNMSFGDSSEAFPNPISPTLH